METQPIHLDLPLNASLLSEVSFEDVKLIVQIKMLQCALKMWKQFGEELRRQGETNRRTQKIRSREIHEWKILLQSQEQVTRQRQLQRVKAEETTYLQLRHLLHSI